MWETITAIAVAIGKMCGFGEKAIQPDAIRIDNHIIEKPRLEEKELIKIYDNQYIRLVNHWGIDIATDTNLICANLNDEQRASMITDLTDRIFHYRSCHRIIFHKFLDTKEYKDWLAQQNKK